jgi:hypothetical protein
MAPGERGEASARLAATMTYAEIAAYFQAPSREAVGGAIWRYRHPAEVKARKVAQRRQRKRRDTWDESRLTETWAERKARRRREMETENGSP